MKTILNDIIKISRGLILLYKFACKTNDFRYTGARGVTVCLQDPVGHVHDSVCALPPGHYYLLDSSLFT